MNTLAPTELKRYLAKVHFRGSISHVARALLSVMIVLVMLAGSVLRVAAAGLHYGMMSCCCGEHASDESCGCPDCPVAHQDDTDQANQPATETQADEQKLPAPTMNKCGPNASITALASDAPVRISVPLLVLLQQTTTQPGVPLACPLLSRLPVSPDAPPPRS
ncbi:MAG: hypothetical protein KBG15_22680 [Kofleriaceae bacterium]|nr:hypothetical protein [Kofleriaceae bacterium]